MEEKKTTKEEDKLEKELKTLVSRMKNENTALKKILEQLSPDTEQPERKKSTSTQN
jgi:hypothetical protein